MAKRKRPSDALAIPDWDALGEAIRRGCPSFYIDGIGEIPITRKQFDEAESGEDIVRRAIMDAIPEAKNVRLTKNYIKWEWHKRSGTLSS